MFESPNTQPRMLQQHHLRVQERPATIAPKASAHRLMSPKKKKLHIKPPSGEFGSFKKMTLTRMKGEAVFSPAVTILYKTPVWCTIVCVATCSTTSMYKYVHVDTN